MADANLLEILHQRGKRVTLENIVVFGKVRCAIKQPEMMDGLKTSSGMYAILDAFALKCLGENYFESNGYRDVTCLYFTKGSMLIYINDKKWIGKTVKVYGSSTNRGVKIKQQFGVSKPYEGIIAIQFRYFDGEYLVVPNKLLELGQFDSDVRGTVLEDFMASIVGGNLVYPETVDSIMPYEGVIDYEELPLDDIEKEDSIYIDGDERVDVTKIKMNLVYHMNGQEISENYDEFKEDIDKMAESRESFCKNMLEKVNDFYNAEQEEDFDYSSLGYNGSGKVLDIPDTAKDIRQKFVKNIASRFLETVGQSKIRGSAYIGMLIDEIKEGNICTVSGKDKRYSVKEEADELYNMVQIDPGVLFGYNTDFGSIDLLKSNMVFAMAVVGIVTGIGSDALAFSSNWCSRFYSMDRNLWFYTLIRFPYLLGMLGPGLSLVDCDVLYFSFSRYYSKGCLKQENMDMRCKMLFLETLRHASDKDTLIEEGTLKSKKSSYPSLGERYLNKNGFPAKSDVVEALKVLLHPGIAMNKAEVDSIRNVEWLSEERKWELIDNGLLNLVEDKLILESDLEKEFMIYDVLINKGSQFTGLTDEVIDGVIDDFEKEKGFQLEKLQKDGIHLVKFKAAVLSGCAGSGKTTTSDCMTMALKKLENFKSKYKIIYCTPTGKACRRLAEVVNDTVRTINSQFGVGIGGNSYMDAVKKTYKKKDISHIYLMDEMAMCNMSLLYEICRNLGEEDFIYFLGDIRQLSPIGKGNPFALLMSLLPCVELGVNKRAAEGSSVNYNTTLVNCLSDGLVKELSYNNSDFFKIECSDSMIPMKVADAWYSFMNGKMNGNIYEEDDIQVITGYQKEDIIFSAPNLNVVIQKMLRKNDKLLFRHTNREFYENDRVIHTKLNMYSMNRYVEVEKGSFQCVATFGVVNGEVGKLVGVVRSDMVHIYDFSPDTCEAGEDIYENVSEEELKELIAKRQKREDDFRDDSRIRSNRQYFIIVQVYDVELKKDVYILYNANSHMEGGLLVLEGSDLGCLELAYALTTHKMQGSQARVVICVFGSSCNPMFINRNMINTMFTRSREVVCNVGTVVGPESPISNGRKHIGTVKCSDALTVLIDK